MRPLLIASDVVTLISARRLDRLHIEEAMDLAELTSDVIASHDALQSALAEAAVAAVNLVVDPRNPDAAEQCRLARRFLLIARGHMDFEESTVFPRAIRSGVPERAIRRFCEEHARLSELARSVDPLLRVGSVGDDEALVLLRFIHRFEQHVHREEWTLAKHGGC